MNGDAKPAIEFGNFSLTYKNASGNGGLVPALRDVSLTIQPGEIITIVGPSGCGKTTLLRAISDLLSSRKGRVICEGNLAVFGNPPSLARRQKLLAFAFQSSALLPWRTIRENVALPLEIGGGDAGRVDAMLEMVGIGDFAEAMPFEVSGGMRQRVNLARALVQNPRILLMDEPFGSLDEVTRERLNFELLGIHRIKKPTIIFVTHNLSEATLLADRVVILSGRPASIRRIVPVNFPGSRTEDTLVSPEYLHLVREVRQAFAQEEKHT